jgi:hypothetical protein
MPSPTEDMLCASLEISGRLKTLLDVSSDGGEAVKLRCFSVDALEVGIENFRHTNFSKSCSSLHSLSPM